MLKVLTVFGTRPEAIKLAPVVKELARHSDRILSRVCVTAQHRQMLDQVLELFRIVPDYDLNLMRDAQSPSQVAAAVLTQLEPILARERPDWVLIQGDTTTVMAAALAGFYAKSQIGHVEAGLRTYDKNLPFPEEVHRRVAGIVADLHFAPTIRARDNLLQEGIPASRIDLSGNPVVDALYSVAAMPYDVASGPLASIPFDRRLVLVTAHRRENFGEPLAEVCAALRAVAERHRGEVHIVYPVHPNPEVALPVERLLGTTPGITLLPPLDYLSLVHLLKRCYLVLTDSGGLQEEAPSLGRPVLVLRETTERPEVVEAGVALLVGTNRRRIVETTNRLLSDSVGYQRMAQIRNPFGDGKAAQRIVAKLLSE